VKLADLVQAVIESVRPENVDHQGTTVTGEGPEVEIVIVPHRALSGVSLVAWTDGRKARLLWAQVGDLSTHDDLDLGVVVASIPREGDWQGRLRNAIEAELRRPIRLRTRTGWFRSPSVVCSIVTEGRDRRVGVVKLQRVQVANPETSTSLALGPRPSFSVPPSITLAR
jgi:hypothetical protein